ncbi:hypothetical protein DH2020_029833 [Rehmannia glutinosa]|uniref:Protein MULTIPOLAR SPINDLE 1 n=1 Tax=Rehmannia glutinosa TaxID=99300 RepID=A0ABR0VMD8_REHGL
MKSFESIGKGCGGNPAALSRARLVVQEDSPSHYSDPTPNSREIVVISKGGVVEECGALEVLWDGTGRGGYLWGGSDTQTGPARGGCPRVGAKLSSLLGSALKDGPLLTSLLDNVVDRVTPLHRKMENLEKQANGDLNPSLKLAIAMAIVESRRRQKISHPSATTTAACNGENGNNSESDAIKWKRKAKQRKEEIIRLKEDLKISEGKSSSLSHPFLMMIMIVFDSVYGVHQDVFPQNVSCKCYFYDNFGQLSPKHEDDQKRFGDVLHRRFLRQVRLSERKRKRHDGLSAQSSISVADNAVGNQMEQLRASVDFLVELCETSSPLGVEEGNFRNWSHQATDFIHATLKPLSSGGKIDETIESIVSSLIVRLMRRMCSGSQGDELVHSHNNFQFYVQHLMRKLGSDPYVGQRVILSVSQRISIVAESLLFMDPFDGDFPKMHNCMYLMIQLIEFLISDNLLSWSTRQDFDTKLLEEWVISIFNARRALELLESRNALYMLYMDRVVGDLTRRLGNGYSLVFSNLCSSVILFLSHFPFPTTAYERISKSSNEIRSPFIEQGEQTLDCKQPYCFLNSREMVVQIKQRVRTVPRAIPGGTGGRTRSSAVRGKTSLLQVFFVLSFSIFFAFFLL